MQQRKSENGICKRNVWSKVLYDAGKAWNKGDDGQIKGFFAICGIFLCDGVLNADNHCRKNVEQVKPDEEWQQPPELERSRMAVVCEPVNADSYANKNTDDAWS